MHSLLLLLKQLLYFNCLLEFQRMNKKDYEQFMRHCQVVQKLSEQRTLIKVQPTQQLIMVRNLHGVSADLVPILMQQKELSYEHLESIIDYYQISNDTIVVFTEYSTHTLEQELHARQIANTPFSLQQLENILVSVIKALQYLETMSIGHGCISARDIVVSQNGTVKLIDPALATNSPLQLMSGYYYSPQLLAMNCKNISNGQSGSFSIPSSQQIDFFKNDIFVLGMLIIQLGLMHHGLAQCVQYDVNCIDYIALQKYLNQFQHCFNNTAFINLLCGMLQEDPSARFSATQALNFIQQQFDQSEEDQQCENNSMSSSFESSYLYQSKSKTVKSFLLSQGPVSSADQSLKNSQQGAIENQIRVGRLSISKNGQNKRGVPLIKC